MTVAEIRRRWDEGLVPDDDELDFLLASYDRLWEACNKITLFCGVYDDQADAMQILAMEALEGSEG